MDITIRNATLDDIPAITDIYNQSIAGTYVSFDYEPWTVEQRAGWFEKYAEGGPLRCLVATVGDAVVGTSYSSPFRPKDGYRRSIETTVVVDDGHLGARIGHRLLKALIEELRREPVHRVYAVIALPNDASVALHARLGYRTVGVLDEVGYKMGTYWSTQMMELKLE